MTEPFTDTVVAWLRANPGQHPPAHVAAALGVTATRAAQSLIYLADKGRVLRKRGERANGPGSSTYSAG